MTTLNLSQQKSVIIAAEPIEFIDAVASSYAALSNNLAIVPIQNLDDCLLAMTKENRCLIVIDPKFEIKKEQFELIRRGISCGAKWCSLKTYRSYLLGYTEILDFRDLLEWLEHSNLKSDSLYVAQLKCLLRRLTAAALMACMSPLFLLISIGIKVASPGPVIYRQTRVGFRGKTFQLLKFRSMHIDAEKNGPQWSNGETDPRTFTFGKFLRKSHLDELPQLWNIIKGDLCFIGPRPERPEFHKFLETEIPHFDSRTRVKPGITGWAQLRSGYASSIEDCKKKIAHDLFYIRNSGISMQLGITFKTIQKISVEVVNFILSTLLRFKTKIN